MGSHELVSKAQDGDSLAKSSLDAPNGAFDTALSGFIVYRKEVGMISIKTRLKDLSVVILILVAVFSGDCWAHGGQYGKPGGGAGTPGPKPGNPRSGGVTPGSEPTWLNWWDRNREEFFDVRHRRLEQSDNSDASKQKYAPVNGEHRSATKDDIRNRIVPTLLGVAGNSSAEVRDATAIALGRAGKVPVLKALQKLLADKNRRVRQGAIMGLGLLRHAMAQQVLSGVLLDPSTPFKERGMAAIALGLGGGDKAQEMLAHRLGKRQPFGKLSAIKARQVDGCRALGLGLLGRQENAQPLMAALSENDSKDKSFPAMAFVGLAKLGDPLATKFGLKGLKNRKNDTRRGAAIMLGRTVDSSDKKTVKALLKHWKSEKDAHARYFLTISLGRIGGGDILNALKKNMIKNKNREDRAFSALALGVAQDHSAAEDIIRLMKKERDVSLRGAMAISLAIMDYKDANELLFKTLKKTKNPDLRSFLITSLAMMDHRPALMEIRQVLAAARNERLVRSCGFAMAVMYDEDSLEHMVSNLKNSGSIQVKGGMASAIGRTGDRRVIAPLIKLINEPSETNLTRAFAIVALGLVGDKAAKSELSRVSIDSNYAMVNAQAFLEIIDIF
ncbi:MAG: HEAT repeat protein [Planctomycetota bacterium]|jgi:HEAT repeat protein